MKRQRLSAKAVEKQRRSGYFGDGHGLYLQVTPTRAKSWIFRYTLNGRAREMGLGSARTVTLAEARRKAHDARKLLDDRIDPIDKRKAEHEAQRLEKARALTFAQCAERYIEAHRAGWRNAKHAYQWTQSLGETYCAPINALPVADVDTGAVLRVLEPIWNTKAETAIRLRARIERVLDWATTRGYREVENPARWRGHLQNLLSMRKKRDRVTHHPALPYEQIGAFMEALRAQEGTAARALEFVILTAARTGEVINAKPEEFDLAKALWTVPAARMKGGREHRVPLSPRAVGIIEAQPEGEHVFPGAKEGQPLSNMAMLMLLKRMGRGDLTVHGFRSTFRDWTAERTSYAREVCEMALAHTIGDATEAAYRRGDLFEKRRRLMGEWSRYCERPSKAAKVLKIKKSVTA
jgi:integrase